MAYLEDDFTDDDVFVELADEDLDLVFRVTDDGEVWDDADESNEPDRDEWDDYADGDLGRAYEDLQEMGWNSGYFD